MPSPLRTRVIEYADPCARSLREHVKVNPKISHVLNLTADQLQRIGVLSLKGSQLAVIDGVASRQSVCPKQLGTVNFKNFRRHERRRVRLARGYLVSSLLIYLHQGGSHAETHLAKKVVSLDFLGHLGHWKDASKSAPSLREMGFSEKDALAAFFPSSAARIS